MNYTDRVRWQTLKGQNLYSIDFNSLSGDDLVECILFCNLEFETKTNNSYILINIHEIDVNMEALGYLVSTFKKFKPQVIKTALYGNSNFIKKFFSIYKKLTGSKAEYFSSKSEALTFLNA